jgi:hypothetical protein
VHGLELPTVKFQVSSSQAVLETVEFDEPAFTKRNAKMLSAKVPNAFDLEGIIQTEPFYFAWEKQGSPQLERRVLNRIKGLSTRHNSRVERVRLKLS